MGGGFCSRRVHEKRDTTRSHREVRGISQPTKFNQNWHVSSCCDVINHTKFVNDRSREYKVTDCRILACSIKTACRL